ncbi:MAG: response regulator transcription factor [Polyangiales bacterium]
MKALVVEDDRKVARLLSRVLQEEGYVVDVCASGFDAEQQGAALAYDLVVVDWMLPEGDGLGVCRALRRRGVAAPILMLTARGEVAERVMGLEAGADDYLVKPFHVEEFAARVRALHRRARGSLARVTVGGLTLDRVARTATVSGRPVELTAREFALLDRLARGAGEPVSRSELLAHGWEAHFDPGSNLVEVHMSRLREKFGADAWRIETVRGKGYRLRADEGGAA